MNKYFRLLVFVLALFGCAGKKSLVEEPPKIRAVQAVLREIADETSGFGSLSFLTKVDITAPQEGVIQKLYFREGEQTYSGRDAVLLENPQIVIAVERAENNYSQALAALDLAGSRLQEGEYSAEAQLLAIEKTEAELVQAKRSWEEDRRKYRNQEILYEAGGLQEEAIRVGRFALESEWERILILEKELEIRRVGCRDRDLAAAGFLIPEESDERRKALINLMTLSLRAELVAASARLQAMEKELFSVRIAQEELKIKSPASGVVGARYFEEGERVKAGEKLFTLLDTASLYALFPVREKDALRIGKGMDAVVLVDGIGENRNGRVDLVYPQADSQSLSFLVRVLLDDRNGDLKPGMFVRVTVALGSPRKIITIPESSIVNRHGGEGTVFVINGSRLSARNVVLGSLLGEDREIGAGINAGELLVSQPGVDIREGIYVSLEE
jgi:RND family efflux transporter MFP subunit